MASQPTWAELLGHNDWASLLDPLHPSLRTLILRCGDFIQGTYDAFNNDKNSPFCGSSRYGKTSFFRKVMLDDADHYDVTAFLYATARVSVPEAFLLHSLSREAWDRESNWIGYVAVTSDSRSKELGRREIYVVWRGTTRDLEWINVFGASQESASALLNAESVKELKARNKDGSSSSDEEDDSGTPKVMLGWLTIYTSDDPNSPFTKTSARTQVVSHVKSLLEQYKSENPSVLIMGHSLGASLSIVSGFDLVENGVTDVPVTAIVFGSPQVGNRAFNNRLKRMGNLKVLHVTNVIDLIPHYPGRLLGYEHTGVELVIDTRKSPSLKESKNPSDWHNLQAMLHVVAGWNGARGVFELKVKRSLALVNKSCSFLKDECGVPESWWVEKNKGMVKREDGEWVSSAPDEEDVPVPEQI
ncbi:phospholipase A1-IIdelta [Vigna unguiculata]|uniref:phospholipase A1-IIdelta n=1 Tax=Vigna unguiculata TaxID=3917 RepID=UPI001015DDCF|nr:phospholipase A1-IIdelta [Vigna unguiculata]XP_027910581.1 phospholipase A1-IIdelta [Vigna unguiculata]XP_027910582.1 phospholipase A1-IIdelta [Vigna unguiculata]XP_027910583.1 phospholipase A1-IIdelta [Vigna unguiculata]